MTTPDPLALRSAFGSFMTGVTVVTGRSADGTPVGFTANSFSSVSLDPPLLLVCPGKFLSSFEAFSQSTQFAVNVLSEGQEEVATTFASFKGDRYARTPHFEDPLGNLMITGALARFSCTTHQVIGAGDHAILIGQVQHFDHQAGQGLGYANGQFFSLGLERAALEQDGGVATCGAIITQGDAVLLERTAKGYRPPQAVCQDRGHLREAFTQALSARGLSATLGPAYSVFDDSNMHFSYFLATAPVGATSHFEAVPIDTISSLDFASKAITDMMTRFALETRSHSFGLYIGDATRGDVHPLPERT